MANALLNQPRQDTDAAHSLRLAIFAPLAPGRQLEFEDRFRTPVMAEGFGQTECVQVTQSGVNGPRDRGTSGPAAPLYEVRIVDEEDNEVPAGVPGEIVVRPKHAHTMYSGYWNKPEATRETFQNILKSRTSPSHAEGAADEATWVRTGDLGAFHDGDLYITGRVKDLVIIDGRNHYPQDLEYSAQESTKAVRTGFVAAFSVPANQLPDEVFENAHAGLKRDASDSSEQLVIVAERAPGSHKLDLAPIADDIRAAIAVRHGVTVRDVLLTPAGAIPRTSSGKIGRRACRSAYLDGTLRSGKVANAFPDDSE